MAVVHAGRCAVSIHAPAWGATHAINTGLSFLVLFQSTHPRGVRQARHRWHLLLSAFQSTHPRGVRPAGRVPDQHALIGFNPRTRVGCDCPCQPFSAAGKSFNPRTRVGCDVGQQPVATVALVSIHAPAWGATGVNLRTCKHHEKVSIHAPAWGATHAINTGLSFLVLFQSTHPRGVRHPLPLRLEAIALVSIHAPAWGATSPQ